MRGAITCGFAVLVIAAAVVAKPDSVSLTAADLSYRYAIRRCNRREARLWAWRSCIRWWCAQGARHRPWRS